MIVTETERFSTLGRSGYVIFAMLASLNKAYNHFKTIIRGPNARGIFVTLTESELWPCRARYFFLTNCYSFPAAHPQQLQHLSITIERKDQQNKGIFLDFFFFFSCALHRFAAKHTNRHSRF